MRQIILSMLLGSLLWLQPVGAQNQSYPNAVHAKLNFSDYGLLNDDDLRLGQGFEVGYFRNIAPFLNVGLPVKLGLAKLPGQSGNTVTGSIDLVFQLTNTQSSGKIQPYAFGGAGYYSDKHINGHLQFPFGAGLNYHITEFASVNLQGEFRKALEDQRDNIQIGLGFVYLLHKVERPVEPPSGPADADKDGVPDVLDKCPELPGPSAALGCPDADGDGIGDTEDTCPDQPGPIETSGCPDQDNDGFPDIDDECPTEAGTVRGCPDTDYDGFANKDDECPDQPGRWNGCPDTDFDGVADKDDKCPNDPGPASNNGCPQSATQPVDSDGDGVADKDDDCPNTAGPASNKGCPVPPAPTPTPTPRSSDRDGDGVEDSVDPCPDKAGSFNGCPDSDGDGVADNLDRCPNTAGPSSNRGCPEIKQETKQQLTLAMDAVQFETGKSALLRSSYDILDGIVEVMRQYPDYQLSISGHTDNVGDDERNMRLSTERAKSCYDYLIFKGVRADRLRYAGFGELRPIADNKTAGGRERNRRVEFDLTLD